MVKACLDDLGRDPKRFPPRGIHARISAEKNNLVSASEFSEQVGDFFERIVADVYELYERRLHASNAMDFDDLLVRTVDLFERFPDVRERWPAAFAHVLVDEYQDTNRAQYRLVRLLADGHRNVVLRRRRGPVGLCVPRRRHPQHPRLRDGLPGRHDRAPRAELPLDAVDPRRGQRGHRAQREPPPRSASGATSATGEPVRVVEVENEHAEARLVATRIGELMETGTAASEIAVFYRTNAQSRVLEDLLVRHNVPYQVIGGPRSTSAPRSATPWRICRCSRTRPTTCRSAASSTRPGAGSARPASSASRCSHSRAAYPLTEAVEHHADAGLGTAAERAVASFAALLRRLRSERRRDRRSQTRSSW